MNGLIILSSKSTGSIDQTLEKMMCFLGASVSILDYRDNLEQSDEFRNSAGFAGLALHADTFSTYWDREDFRRMLRAVLAGGGNVFLHGISQATPRAALESLTDSRVRGVEVIQATKFACLPGCGKRFSRQLSGAQFSRESCVDKHDDVLSLADGQETNSGAVPVITLSNKPSFLSLPCGNGHLFMSTAKDMPDPDKSVGHDSPVDSFYDSVLSVMIFVRFACGDYCWQGGYYGARVIIDDPVLRRKYGQLDFQRLFVSLERHRYAATVAFIPWNHMRTSTRQASFFDVPEKRFTLCVHGCDHTNNEYGVQDEGVLMRKSQLALERMRKHEKRTGIGFEAVMVFPQGKFSACSLRALRAAGFLAAINTTRFPVDDDGETTSLGDLLLPATSKGQGVPVFGRDYPKDPFPFLLDLFLGRPSFIVEHHDFFEAGFPMLESLVDQMNACQPQLSWGPLQETLERVCWQRAISSTLQEVRFFTDRFHYTNCSDRRLRYRLWKQELDQQAVAAANFGGPSIALERLGNALQIEIELDPGQTVQISVLHALSVSLPSSNETSLYACKVLVRRALSEFRDEVLIKHPALLLLAKSFVTLLGAASD